ncbi:MAG: alpha-amylase [Bacteroidetes bacterium]|nr:alpha-amylase [Bacteroidota bacterium]
MKLARILLVSLVVLAIAQPARSQSPGDRSFSWNNPVIYHVLTDRFENGDPTNDNAYGRGLDGSGNPYESGPESFFGGDLRGLTSRVNSGYLDSLGVNVIWITAPYEQVHGFVSSADGRHQAYPYHGYWPLDFTQIDANWGSEADFAAFVDACHARGIRVLIDVVLNHPGYATTVDMAEFDFGGLADSTDWHTWRPGPSESWADYQGRFVDFEGSDSTWIDWWGPDWIRAGLPGYGGCGDDDQTTCLSYLPDFRTDSATPATLPTFLSNKWTPDELQRERESLDSFFARTKLGRTPRNHLIKWLTDWVRKYGVDGFRIDTAKHVELPAWSVLKNQAQAALRAYRADHPDALNDARDFWMLGEVYGYNAVDPTPTEYFDNGFDALLNFGFTSIADASNAELDFTYGVMADAITASDEFGIVSFVSNHDVGLMSRERLRDGAVRLMLAPGGVAIYYGDEIGRRETTGLSDAGIASRSPMDWSAADKPMLEWWRMLGQFRQNHPALASGEHELLSNEPYTFMRTLRRGTMEDVVVAVLGAEGRTRLHVAKAFPDDAIVRDAVSGATAFVSFGYVTIQADPSGVILLELSAR